MGGVKMAADEGKRPEGGAEVTGERAGLEHAPIDAPAAVPPVSDLDAAHVSAVDVSAEKKPLVESAAEEPAAVAALKEAEPSTSLPVAAAPTPAPETPMRPLATLRLDRKHPLAIRWMHWVNFPVLFIMIWSGVMIYWNDSDNAHKYQHQVYRVGIGSFTLFRFFPEWFYNAITTHGVYHVPAALAYHFFFMWLFAINGILYVLFTVLSGEWRFIVPERKSLIEAIQVTLVDLHLRKGMPAQKKYNAAQRIAYTSVVFMGLGSLITGLSIYKPTQLHWLTTALGGYEMARWEHFLLTMAFCGFFLVHVLQVVLAGWNNFRSMVSGLEIKSIDEPSLEGERRSWS